ncbi:GlsB/YeaQ/YmgE family stress response membrane protein [Candidatus Dojkabacteria bacterium CG_4_9_14_3_um_filter_150_Dojkabacteria_WS6_41_13]|uniref:GlsB/YeaQ/YmgE family stress response membrane protein n=1 Tax=Candidatus Dojkabacteria bacterium CG_4_10_14_0_2_um_filter_Dojkabacteria_WS6_41_15 TaxID=2014249 RepID=A0A2M7W164_9BACT|nr:MAG: GlsB/YeaQ/YmgE family stress response membrane protein [Candidatus Dojkabacteria bacterium CG_4_10_14_3_um_filter_Dojkabacteria_WS6_41_9]PJA12912.1 MAG: GlsB/YeaQ/YmgE family stress response membrane protein [Candidatus Dojkabacteria bacterium CG_4_10_14_0_2_um_filter_Dojkabacteria_WS6_41_15]PJB23740.1 MAG: GlsB/YeaQ/YmgE family stress response membrane protein [Candidatus Dojkabacteria bacterium CG_4_9_14_3_um_filter_150_Dojkabacteria_WS6_41_13]
MSFIYWIVFGLIAGSIANFLSPSAQGGILGSIFLGIIGAVVGGYFGEMFFGVGVTGFNVKSFTVAVLGALLVLFIGRMIMRG